MSFVLAFGPTSVPAGTVNIANTGSTAAIPQQKVTVAESNSATGAGAWLLLNTVAGSFPTAIGEMYIMLLQQGAQARMLRETAAGSYVDFVVSLSSGSPTFLATMTQITNISFERTAANGLLGSYTIGAATHTISVTPAEVLAKGALLTGSFAGSYTGSDQTQNGVSAYRDDSVIVALPPSAVTAVSITGQTPTEFTATITAGGVVATSTEWRIKELPNGAYAAYVLETGLAHTFTGLDQTKLYEIEVRAVNGAGPSASFVRGGAPANPWIPAPAVITSPSTSTLNTGATPTYTATATGSGVIVYSLVSAPAGWSINPSTGVVTGPILTANQSITIIATNGVAPPASQVVNFTVSALPQLVINGLPSTTVTGNTYPITVTSNGVAVAGVAITIDGNQVGVTNALGQFNLVMPAIGFAIPVYADKVGYQQALQVINITAFPVGPTITSAANWTGTHGQVNTFTHTATSGTAPYVWSISNATSGATINPSTGVITFPASIP